MKGYLGIRFLLLFSKDIIVFSGILEMRANSSMVRFCWILASLTNLPISLY